MPIDDLTMDEPDDLNSELIEESDEQEDLPTIEDESAYPDSFNDY